MCGDESVGLKQSYDTVDSQGEITTVEIPEVFSVVHFFGTRAQPVEVNYDLYKNWFEVQTREACGIKKYRFCQDINC